MLGSAGTTADKAGSHGWHWNQGLGQRLRTVLAGLVLPVLIGIAWWLGSSSAGQMAAFVPTPAKVAATAVQLIEIGYRGRSLEDHIWATFSKVLYSFIFVTAAGVPIGFVMGRNRIAEALMDPLVEFFRPLPSLAYLTLLIIWFGIGLATQVSLLFLTGFPIAVTGARAAARSVSEEKIRTARAFGASQTQILRYVVLPSSLPAILTSSRIVAGALFGTTIAAEMVSAREGVGWMILDASEFLRADVIFCGIALLALMGVCMDRAFRVLERRLTPWEGHE